MHTVKGETSPETKMSVNHMAMQHQACSRLQCPQQMMGSMMHQATGWSLLSGRHTRTWTTDWNPRQVYSLPEEKSPRRHVEYWFKFGKSTNQKMNHTSWEQLCWPRQWGYRMGGWHTNTRGGGPWMVGTVESGSNDREALGGSQDAMVEGSKGKSGPGSWVHRGWSWAGCHVVSENAEQGSGHHSNED